MASMDELDGAPTGSALCGTRLTFGRGVLPCGLPAMHSGHHVYDSGLGVVLTWSDRVHDFPWTVHHD